MLISLAILLHTQLAHGIAFDAFIPPTPAMKATHYANDCGGVSEDLSGEMPPIDNQNPSNWCATFASRALIEYLVHENSSTDSYKNRISPVDLNSWSTDKSKELRGKFLGLQEGSDPYSVLEGAQNKGELYSETDQPFDQNLFDKNDILQRLSDYYDEEKPFADRNALSCRNQTAADKSLEALFSSLPTVLAQSSIKSSFLDKVNQDYSILETPKANRISISPLFNIRRVEATSGDQEMEEWQNNLRAKIPTVIDICADQLLQDKNYLDHLVPPPFTNSCGGHALVVVGMKTVSGICQIEVRNSWGESWPSANQKGYAWIPATQLLSIMHNYSGTSYLTSITKRAPSDPIQNKIVARDFTYEGETVGETFEGKGRLVHRDGSVEEGQFKNGLLHLGSFKGTFPDGTYYEGAIQDGQANGQGHMKLKNGALMDGSFKNGMLISGKYSGVINERSGQYYEGPMENGHTSSQGRFYFPRK